ncbi:MAG: sugar phosphorylase [Microcoleaceae cyanobacterium]
MTLTSSNTQYKTFSVRIKSLLEIIYDRSITKEVLDRIFTLVENYISESSEEDINKWSESNITLITYGDSIDNKDLGETPLTTLNYFLNKYLKETITDIHILPFFPYSSDDGFSVIDYLSVNPELGSWDEIETISNQFNLMIDLVINHVSRKSEWFQQFKQAEKPGCNYFIEVDPKTDLSAVIRPRSSPLLIEIETVNGTKHVWGTFSEDQIDLNFSNPDVLIEFIKILLFYVEKGARCIRLDAVGFLWKEIGTPCIHLPQTHAVIKLLREILQIVDPKVALITETNVPNSENLSYFGDRNEAHMIYNFSLPPLLINALIQGKSDYLKTWMMSMPPAPAGCTYFNFTASHDGIGLRPVEGLLNEKEYDILLETMRQFGGKVSMRKKSDGTESPYELNISLFDAMKGTIRGEDEWQIQRFLCSQTIMMSLEGIPAFYIHSLLGTHNDYKKLQKKGINRAINRHQWQLEEIEKKLNNPDSEHSIILKELCRIIQIRRRQAAFHPNATQYTLPLRKSLFGFWRQSILRDQSIFCIFNLTDIPQILRLSDLNLVFVDPWCDLISGETITEIHSQICLNPYQSLWITNKFE